MHNKLIGTMGGGGIVSNAKDVSLFDNALFTGNLISNFSLEIRKALKEEMTMENSVSNFNGMTVYGHDGAIDGFHSIAVYLTQLKSTIVLTFTASSGPTFNNLMSIV